MSVLFYVSKDKWQNEVRVAISEIETIEEDAGGSFITLKSGRQLELIDPPSQLEIRIITTEAEQIPTTLGETPPEE